MATTTRALLALTALAAPCGGGESEARPNVLPITLDTTPADRSCCNGGTAGSTPTIDALARAPVEGESLLGPARGDVEGAPRAAYADAVGHHDAHSPPASKLPPHREGDLLMACDGRSKLIWHERNSEHGQPYDLLKDPMELDDVYREDHPMVPGLLAFLEDRGAFATEPPGSGSKAPDVAARRALGDSARGEGEGGDR